MADNEHAFAPLGNSEILRVKHTPRGGSLRSDTDAGRAPPVDGDVGREAGELAEEDREVGAAVVVGSIIIWVTLNVRARARRGGEQTKDVLEENPGGSERINDSYELEEETGPLASQARTASSHG